MNFLHRRGVFVKSCKTIVPVHKNRSSTKLTKTDENLIILGRNRRTPRTVWRFFLIRGPVLVTDAFRAPPVDAFQTPPGRLPGSTVHHRLPPLAGVGSLRWPQRLPTLAAVGSLRWPYRLPPLVAVGSLRGPRRLPPLAAVSSLHWPCRVRCQCPLLTRDFAGVGSGDDGGVGVVGGADGAAAGVGSAASADGAGGADTTAVVGVVGVDGAAGVAGGDGAACGGAMFICIYIYIYTNI